ncbi:MAG: ImmA/IrrE family metallo-endopeptidase [Reyranella sp.]|uniref:ImmA/IrrE family metallo-endopeptidase n=1 Tax=Reyranella sp. TaxID=1929291 RepID=UPI003D0ED1C0
MAIKVRYLSEDEIEKEAELLLAEYAETTGTPFKLPVPVEEITTYHLALRLGFANLHETLRIPMLRDQPDILGAIWVDREAILIDRSLDPKHNPSTAGRYRFSVAHEIGHWRLHRSYVAKDANQASLFDGSAEPTVICRSSQAKEPIEWQANFFSSCLLMPRHRVHKEWQECLGRTRPLLLSDLRPNGRVMMRAQTMIDEQGGSETGAVDDALFEEVAKPIARRFGVSAPAMRIRLEKLGLLLRQTPPQASLRVSP